MSLGIYVRRVGALITSAFVLAATLVAVPIAASAVEGDATAATPLPLTVSADALPTVQIDSGVIWASEIVGDIAYVGGEFSNARPAGAAPGTNLMARGNILAFNVKTGVATSFAPMLNGRVNDIAASPDGTKLYVVGTFTQVNGQTRNRIAVFNLPGGALSTTVVPNINGVTQSVAATNDTVYVGGYFSAVNNSSRARIAAVRASNGTLLPFRPIVDDGMVQALVVSPDNASVVLSGNFVSVAGGVNNPGYGLARVDAATGAQLSLPVNSDVRNAGPNSGITSLKTDGTNFYGVGWHYGSGGNSEGTFAANWTDGSLKWIEDCHGDTYDVAPVGDVVYTASHKHYCGNNAGFPQTNPWSFYHSTAFTRSVEGVNTADIHGYPDHPGKPSPALLTWYPQTDVGTYTGKSQAVWTVDGAGDYVIYGGEFPKVNGAVQQGIVRYASKTIAPNKQGPRYLRGQTSWAPSVQSVSAGTVRISYQTVWDRDDLDLTYRVYRDNENSAGLVDEQVVSTPFWQPKQTKVKQVGLSAGATHRYRVTATDPYGNVLKSDWVNVTVSNAAALPYVDGVIDDGAESFWRLGEASGPTAFDWIGDSDLTLSGGLDRGADGAIAGDPDKSTTFSGGFGTTTTGTPGANSFAVETWIKTTTTAGGKIIGFGSSTTSNSSSYDRHVYMDNSGKIWFGVYPNTVRTINSSASYNDGQWHHIVAGMGPDGMKLYVDGERVAQRADTTFGQGYAGYWRVGGDNLGSWPSQPSSNYFAGRIDDVAVYAAPLTEQQISRHHAVGSATPLPNQPPTAAFTANVNGLQLSVDASTSTDSDGSIASYEWDFGDGTTGTGATTTHPYATVGTKTVTLKVTDDGGLSATTSQQVTTTASNQAPVAAFTSAASDLTVAVDATTSSDPDGTITSYAWNFGDGATATGSTASHSYGSASTYTITLTVTDNGGATNTSAKQVTVTAPVPPVNQVLAVDNFDRSVSNGWGNAEQGGAWTLRGAASRFSVSNGAGVISVPSASTQFADLNTVSSASTRVDAVFSVDKLVEANYVAVVGRRVGSSNYIARLRLQADGGVRLYLLQDDAASIAPMLQVPMTMVPGEKYVLSIEVTGTAPTTVKAKVWKESDPEPTWQRQGTNSAPALQGPGAVSVFSYLPNTTLAPLGMSFDKITVRDPSVP